MAGLLVRSAIPKAGGIAKASGLGNGLPVF
jgi:hypothetical protein